MGSHQLRALILALLLIAAASTPASAQHYALDVEPIASGSPCMMVDDLDFGSLRPGESRTLPLRICNEGDGCRDTSTWTARVVDPGPQLTGYDFGALWIVKGACSPDEYPSGTKNPASEYVSTVYASNTGDAEYDVESLRLIGPDADAGYFTLGEWERISPGDRIRPGEPFRVPQSVIFRPGPDERIYTCEVVLTSTDKKVVRSVLRGVGIESHVQAPQTADFGELQSDGMVEDTLVFTTDGTRDVTISDIVITGSSASSFTIRNRGDLVGTTFPKNSSFEVAVRYDPADVGAHDAQLVVRGDFSPCDDATAELHARRSVLSARTWSESIDSTLLCFEASVQVFVENDGSDPILLAGISLAGDIPFGYNLPAMPDTLMPGDRLALTVTFTPADVRAYSGSLTFDMRDITGVMQVLPNGRPITADFTVYGRKVTTTAHIARDYHGSPGTKYTVDVVLDRGIPEARIDVLEISLRYAHGMMEDEFDPTDLHELLKGTILEGWTVSDYKKMPDPTNPRITVFFLTLTAPAGEFLSGTGPILKTPFVTFAGDTTESELTFFLTPRSRLGCADIVTSHGHATVELVSGRSVSDIVITNDPSGESIEASFTMHETGLLRFSLYNALGELVHSTYGADEYHPGRRSIVIPTAGLAAGQYYLQITGHLSEQTAKVMILP